MASFIPDQELEERRVLLQAAARGCASARLKLSEEYHVRLYSASERKQYAAAIAWDKRVNGGKANARAPRTARPR